MAIRKAQGEMTSTPIAETPREEKDEKTSPGERWRQAVAGVTAMLTRTHSRLMARSRGYGLLIAIVQGYQRQRPEMLAKQSAYSLLYAVPSILLVLISLAVLADKNTDAGLSETMQEYVAEQAPRDTQPLLQSLVQSALVETSENTALVAAAVSLAIAIWGGAGGIGALIYAVNMVYDVRDTRSFLKGALLRIGLLVTAGLLLVTALLLYTFGRRLSAWLTDGSALEDSPLIGFLWSAPLWSFVLLFVSLLILYWFALDTAKSFRWLLPGAVAATAAVAILFAAIERILDLSNPGAAFGAAGGVLILLWALFLLSLIVVLGALLNAVLGHRYDRKLIAGLALHPDKRLDIGRFAVEVVR